nr:cytochrome c biogenesis factor C [Apopellia endiviifolia]
MVQPQNFSFFLIFLVVLRGTAAPVLFQWLVSRDVSTGAPFYNGTIIPISTSLLLVSVLIQRFGLMSPLEAKRIVSIRPNFREAHKNPLNPFLMKQPYPAYPGFFNPFFLDLFRQNQFLFPLFFGQSFVSDRSGLSGTLIRCETSVALPLFFIIKFMGDFSYLESFCGVLCSLLFRTTFFLFKFHRRLARHNYLFLVFHKQRRRKLISSLRSKNSFLVRALPSRLVTYFRRKAPPVNMKISHGGVCIFIMGVILSNARKIQFTGKTPLGSELHIGKVRSTSRGIDQLHGPTFHSICGNLIIYKPIAWITGSPGEFVAKARSGPEMGTRVLEQNSFSHWLTMFPEKRFYFSNQSITKVAIDTNLFTDLYALIGTGSFETGWYTTVIKLPFIFRIWIGFIMASLGGLLSPFRKLTSTD